MDNAFPKVSIGLITFNHADFIVECLDSIRGQTYQNIELFISDDCSTDNTVDIIKNYMEQYPGFITQFFPQLENIGISRNCNLLLEKFTGKYGHIFSGDDIMLPEKTRLQVEALDNHPDAALCFTDMEWFWSETGRRLCNHFGILQKPSVNLEEVIADFSIPTPSLMLNLEKLGRLLYREELAYVNDFCLVVELMLVGSAIYVPAVTVRYRKHKASATMTNFFAEDRKRLLHIFYNILPEKYFPAVRKYSHTVVYAEVMTLIASSKKSKAIARLADLFSLRFITPKWIARYIATIIALVK